MGVSREGSDFMKTIKVNLSAGSFHDAAERIRAYKNDLNEKCRQLCLELCKEGAEIAGVYIAESSLGKYVTVASEITPEKAGCKAVLYMEDSQKIISQWQTLDGVQKKEISPSLMIEFGAGLMAQNPAGIPGVGAGTYGTHGTDPGGWWYMDLKGEWHHSRGIMALLPMYNTGKELSRKVIEAARKVWGQK